MDQSQILLPTRVLSLLNQQKLIRGQTGNSGKALLGPLLQQEGAKTSNRFPCSLPGGRGSGQLVPYMGSFWRGGLGGLPSPLVVLCGFLVSLYLVVQNLPQLHIHAFMLVPYCFFVFCCLSLTVSSYFVARGLSRCKHCSKGSQVPACLNPQCIILLIIIMHNNNSPE